MAINKGYQYLDEAGLAKYDELIKNYIANKAEEIFQKQDALVYMGSYTPSATKGGVGTFSNNSGTTQIKTENNPKGWTYIVTGVTSTLKYLGNTMVENGDMVIINTNTIATAGSPTVANCDVIEVNNDARVLGPTSSTNNHIAVFDGTTGRLIKDGTYTIGRDVAANEDVTAYTGGTNISISNHVVGISMTAVSDPTASGSSLSFIDTISQGTGGRITVTKKNMREASATQSGIVSTGAQTFAGAKTFNENIIGKKNITADGGIAALGIVSTDSGGTVGQLSDLSDVVLNTPSNGQILKYNGSKWVNVNATPDISLTTSGSGNAVTSVSYSNGVFTVTKGLTFLTQHQSIVTGSANGTISVGGADVAVKGLGSLAYKSGIAYNDLTTKPTASQIQTLVGDYVTTFAGKTGAITLAAASTTRGTVTLSISDAKVLSASVVLADWAKAASKPSYNFSEIGTKPTTISGYGITDAKIETASVTVSGDGNSPYTEHKITLGSDYLQFGVIPTKTIQALFA